MLIEVKIPRKVYNKVYLPFRGFTSPIEIFFGGSSSGKSVFLAQRLVKDLLAGGRNYLCVRNTGNSLKSSVFNEIKQVIDRYNARQYFKINKSDMTFTCINGYQAILKGLDDTEKIKSIVPKRGVITDIWIEEATEAARAGYKELTKRLRGRTEKGIRKRLILSFNPIVKTHWIFKEFFNVWVDNKTKYKDKSILILKTTFKENRFLDKDDVTRLVSEKDPYYREVYTLGNWGILGGVIFKNWRIEDLKGQHALLKTFDVFLHGLDFGYSNDPTAYNKMYYHSATKKLYIIEEWNAKEVTNPEIADGIQEYLGEDTVVCDSAEPKSIKELNNCGINAIGAEKGKDSIIHGIQWLQQQEIIIDRSNQNTINNFQLYHWQEDRSGNSLNKPVDKDNDHIDEIRYACEELMLDSDELDLGLGSELISAQGM